MTFTILAILEVASLVVLAVSLHGSVRAVYERDKLRKQTPLTTLALWRSVSSCCRRMGALRGGGAGSRKCLVGSALHGFRRR